MAYRIDPYDKSIVIEGFEQGIADSPFSGISDMRNVNIISVPGEFRLIAKLETDENNRAKTEPKDSQIVSEVKD